MFSIGEFSKISGLSVKTPRFYHEKGLLAPAAVDPQTGYRYYDRHSLERAQVIVALRDLDFPLDTIAEMLAACRDDQDALAHLERHRASLAEKLRHVQGLVDKIDGIIRQQRQNRETLEMNQGNFEIVERGVEPQLVAGIRLTGKYSDIGVGFKQLGRKVGRYIRGNAFCLYYDCEYREEDANFEPCFPLRKAVEVEGIDVRTLPAAHCVTLLHQGPYDTLGSSYARVMDYACQHGYEVELPIREVYLKGPGMLFRGNSKRYLTEIQIPIKR